MKKIKCNFCGGILISESGAGQPCYVEGENRGAKGGANVVICEACVRMSHAALFGNGIEDAAFYEGDCREAAETAKPKISNFVDQLGDIPSPSQIRGHLEKHVIGQPRYVKMLSLFGFNHMRRVKDIMEGRPAENVAARNNLFVVGSTGVGKTHGVATLAAYLKVPVLIYDVSGLTADGYIGQSVGDILDALYTLTDGDAEQASAAIIALDEIDKIARRATHSRDICGESIQVALLKMIDSPDAPVISQMNGVGDRRSREPRFLPQGISYVAMGAFSDMGRILGEDRKKMGFTARSTSASLDEIAYSVRPEEDIDAALVAAGMLPEFLGRWQTRSVLEPLDMHALTDILLRPGGIVEREKVVFEREGIHLNVTVDAARTIAGKALSRRRGARALNFEFNELISEIKFRNFGCGTNVRHVEIGSDTSGEIKVSESIG